MANNNKNNGKNKKQEGFDVLKLLSFVSEPEQKFAPKMNKKMWDDAEIMTLGILVKHIKDRGIKNPELKKAINERIDEFEKYRKQKDYKSDQVNPITEEYNELDKIKKARDEINLSRLSVSKKLSDKTKNLLKDAFKKAMKKKAKKAEIIVDKEKNQKTENKNKQTEISAHEKKHVDDMLDVALKSGVIDKNDLELH